MVNLDYYKILRWYSTNICFWEFWFLLFDLWIFWTWCSKFGIGSFIWSIDLLLKVYLMNVTFFVKKLLICMKRLSVEWVLIGLKVLQTKSSHFQRHLLYISSAIYLSTRRSWKLILKENCRLIIFWHIATTSKIE